MGNFDYSRVREIGLTPVEYRQAYFQQAQP